MSKLDYIIAKPLDEHGPDPRRSNTRYQMGDMVKLYLAGCEDDKLYVGGTWRVIAANTRRCLCEHCMFNWTAGGQSTRPFDYVLDISPENDRGPVLLVYEWQLLPPLEESVAEVVEEFAYI